MIKFLVRYYLYFTFLLLGVITFLSLYPVAFPEIPGKDKTGHFIAYAACVLPVSFARPKSLYMILLAIILWSGFMEIVQPFVNRHKDILDFAANSGGVIIGYFVGWGLNKVLVKNEWSQE